MIEQVEGQLTLFPADSPASRSPLPGSKEARKMTATSGQKWLGLSKNSGPLGLLEKMLLESLEWHSPIFYLNWKPVGIRQGHFLFQLALSEPGTDVTEWQSWPTPTAADSYTDKIKSSQQKEGSRHSVNLSSAVKMWATPNTMDYLPQRSPEALKRQAEGNRKGRKRPANLREQVNPETVKIWEEPKVWKTPVAADAANRKMYVNSRGEPNLSGQVKLWPTPKASLRGDCPSERNRKSPDLAAAVKMYNTPTAQDAKNSTFPQSQIKRGSLVGDVMRELFPTPTTGAGMCGGTGNYQQLKKLEEKGVISENERKNMSQGNGGQLNPYWVEWLMGFPPGWTDI